MKRVTKLELLRQLEENKAERCRLARLLGERNETIRKMEHELSRFPDKCNAKIFEFICVHTDRTNAEMAKLRQLVDSGRRSGGGARPNLDDVWLLESLWVDDDHIDDPRAAFGYEVMGYATSEKDADAIIAAGGVYTGVCQFVRCDTPWRRKTKIGRRIPVRVDMGDG